MLQYKIPQNVGIEDKIVGPFSLRQLIILAVGGGISYVLFTITSRIYEMNIIEYILVALPALFALAIAMLKIHNVTFGKYILLMFEFAIKPKKRMWDHRGISALVDPDLTDTSLVAKKTTTNIKERKDINLRSLSATLDSGGFEHVEQIKHEDIDEVQDDDLITEAYFGHKQKNKTDNMYWRTRDMQKKKLDLLAKIKPTQKTIPKPAENKPAEIPPVPPVREPIQPSVAPVIPANNETIKKESVVEHLAGIIKEARQNNASKEVLKKKRKRRRRKSKAVAQPIRQDTQINTTSKSTPDKIIKKTNQKEMETSFSDLSGSGEIEINLD